MSYPAEEENVTDLSLRHFVMPCLTEERLYYLLWWHDCPAVEHISWGWIGDRGDTKSGHVITAVAPLSVHGSLICADCGDHGHITAGRWVPC